MSIGKRVSLAAALSLAGLSTTAFAQEVKEGPGKEVFVQHCNVCHELATVTTQRHTGDEWTDIVAHMMQNGAQLTEAERVAVLGYLTKAYPPDAPAGTPPAK